MNGTHLCERCCRKKVWFCKVNYPALKCAFVHLQSLLLSSRKVGPTHPSSFTSDSKFWLCGFQTVSLYLPCDLQECVHVQKCVTVRQWRATHSSRLILPFSSTVISRCCLASLASLITAASMQEAVLMITHVHKLKHKYLCVYSIMNKYRHRGTDTGTRIINHTVSKRLSH